MKKIKLLSISGEFTEITDLIEVFNEIIKSLKTNSGELVVKKM